MTVYYKLNRTEQPESPLLCNDYLECNCNQYFTFLDAADVMSKWFLEEELIIIGKHCISTVASPAAYWPTHNFEAYWLNFGYAERNLVL